MTFWQLIRRNLRYHARAHLGVVLGAAIGSAALIGALVVGDSVRESLTSMALRRLGNIHFALSTQDHLFQTGLGPRLRNTQARVAVRTHTATPPTDLTFRSWSEAWALALAGVVTRQDGTARANRVNILGVQQDTWSNLAKWDKLAPEVWVIGPDEDKLDSGRMSVEEFKRWQRITAQWIAGETAFINQTLARQLAAREGDEFILRVRKPTALGLDAALSPRNEDTVAVRLKVGAILTHDTLCDFSLIAESAPPANLFLNKGVLADKLGLPNEANLLVTTQISAERRYNERDRLRDQAAYWLLMHAPRRSASQTAPMRGITHPNRASVAERVADKLKSRREVPIPDELALPCLKTDLARAWLPEDAGLSVKAIVLPPLSTDGKHVRPAVELTSSRIFLEPSVIAAALKPRTALLTNREDFQSDKPDDIAYAQFVTNGVRILTYLANLIQARGRATPYSMVTAADGPFVPADMRDDEILVNQWLADDLQVKPGDAVAMSYYLVDSGSRLAEHTNSFRVRGIVPLKGPYADHTLMPNFPGLAKAESTHDWDAGFPLVYPIRDKDEAYWKAYRGTPKAFVTLAAGQAMWANRFGTLTAIRYDVPTNTFASTVREAVHRNLLANLRPEDVGLRFEPVRAQALKAAAQSQDFGQLFLGFSLFLVAAALLLMALLFQFGLEQRASEVGILLALGLTQ